MICQKAKTCQFPILCGRIGYCKYFDFDGTPMGPEKVERNKLQQAEAEARAESPDFDRMSVTSQVQAMERTYPPLHALPARLRAIAGDAGISGEMRDLILKSADEIEELREALKPFAEAITSQGFFGKWPVKMPSYKTARKVYYRSATENQE